MTLRRPSALTLAIAIAIATVVAGCASSEPPATDTVDPAPTDPLPPDPGPVPAVVIDPRRNWAIYTHGGDPAQLSSVGFTVRNNLEKPAQMRVEKVELLRGGDCNTLPRDVASAPVSHGIGEAGAGPTPSMEVAPGAVVDVDVHFDPVQAAPVSCDRTVFRVYFLVNDAPRISLAEVEIEREEPLPRP